MSLAITFAEAATPPLLPTGFRHHVPFDEYRAIQATNISSLKNLARSPRHYRHEGPNGPPPSAGDVTAGRDRRFTRRKAA